MKINCIVIEDSAIQRLILVKLINNHSYLNLLSEFSNALEAKSFLKKNQVDLIFLDIEMPVLDGFDFIDELESIPQIIFVTSKAEYALKAFDYEATDYLKKPLSVERFNTAIKKAILLNAVKEIEFEEELQHIFVKTNLKNTKIFISDIKWIQAFGDYVRIVTDTETHLVLSTMKDFEKELPQDKFMRIHKSYIVNIFRIERFNSKFAEINNSKIPLSRNKKEELVRKLDKNQ